MLPAHEQRALLGLARQQRPKAASQSLRRAADLATHARQQMPVEELKANLLSGASGVYIRLIESLLKQRQHRAAAQALLEAKGGIWADLLEPADVQPPSADWLRARAELTTWQEEARDASNATYREVCEQRIRAAAAALTNAARQQAHERAPHPLPEIDALHANLSASSAVVDYVVGTTYLHACVLTASSAPQWVRLGKHQDIERRMRQFSLLIGTVQRNHSPAKRWAVAQGQRQAIDTCLAELYTLLVAPLEPLLAQANTLLLAPDGFLFAVPWAALRQPHGYLGERYHMVLLPSAAVAGFPPAAYTAVGPPVALGAVGDPPLPAVDHELQVIQQAIPQMQCINPASIRDLATVDAPAVLHIAAHGTTNAEAPLLSSLELADGAFLLADTLRLNLHGTHLVSLSACETGTLPNQGGMLLALAGAFLCAGAQSVLASLWPVDDEATRQLMEQVYAAVGQGTPLPHALAQAQQAIRAAGSDHPFYWAAFQVIIRSTAPLATSVAP
jgi:CHAT domain-containing protein